MSHTYSSNRVHVVFSTKEREPQLDLELQPKLWAYIAGIARNHGFEAIKVGGFIDHLHALILVPPTMPLAKAVQLIKGSSSHWLNQTGGAGKDFAWQEGYGAFSVSASRTGEVVGYIANQAAHHVKRNYKDEFLQLLKKHGIEYDPVQVLG